MKSKFLAYCGNIFSCMCIGVTIVAAQPTIELSASGQFEGRPMIMGKTENNYFCLYPAETSSQLVIYNKDLVERKRLAWNSIVSNNHPLLAAQASTIGNNLVLFLQQNIGGILNVRSVELNDEGVVLNDKTIMTDSAVTKGPVVAYDIELSKNKKYVLLYRGIKVDANSILFKGSLMDAHFNKIKPFNFPVEKQETEESWLGATVDIEGNIHTIVFSAEDSWRKGSLVKIHTIAMGNDDLISEQIEVGKRRLVDFSLREDTSSHIFQLKAISTILHNNNDPLAGLSFITFPYNRTGKIAYNSYDFTAEQKKEFAKNITAVKKLLESSRIESSLTSDEGGSYYTYMSIGKNEERFSKPPEISSFNNPLSGVENYRSVTDGKQNYGADPSLLPPKMVYGGSVVPRADDRSAKLASYYEKQSITDPNQIRTVRIVLLKNTENGSLESWTERLVTKGVQPEYEGMLPIVKKDSLQILTYIVENKRPALYMVSADRDANMNKLAIPESVFLLLSDASFINTNTALVPYVDRKNGELFGIAKITF